MFQRISKSLRGCVSSWFFAFFILCFFCSSLFGSNWQNIGPDGGSIWQIISLQSSLYVVTYSKGLYGPSYIFKSIDKGNTFFEITPPEITAPQNADSYIQKIAVDYKNENIIYVATAGGVFKSENGGDSFFKCGLDGEVVRTVAIDPANADIVLPERKKMVFSKALTVE